MKSTAPALDTLTKYFANYGEVVDSVIMKDRMTGQPRGFGFITYADPGVVDIVIKEDHIINDKQVEIKRTIPKGAAAQTNGFKTKKIFVGGIPATVTEDELKDFFSKYGNVMEHEIILDHATKRSRGFGFVVFDHEKVVDEILADGNMIDMSGSRVEIKKAEPKKASNPASGSAFGSDSRARNHGGNFRGYPDNYSGFGSGYSPASYRAFGAFPSRFGDYGGYGGGDYGEGYGGFGGAASMAGYRGEPSYGYSGRYGPYGGALGGGYGSGLGMFGRAGAMYGSRAGYSGSSRYHPYA
uniref:RRM domain-containing protein n=1 Tax=Chenopodium quinoa TaxID=63459 RepID=A0A803MGM8_CHEQI